LPPTFPDDILGATMRSGLNILLVEDDENDALFFQRALRSLSRCHLNICRDGECVLRYLQGEGEFANRHLYPLPDVMFLDLKMPRVTGFDVLRWIREHPRYVVIPTIVLSSSKLESDVVKAYALGANCYLVKPHSLDELKNVLKLTIEFWTVCQRPVAVAQVKN
jgi:CheY-like chemotaxis protein